MAEDDQSVEKLKPCRHDNEHVDGGSTIQMIVQERPPSRGGHFGSPRQVSADRRLADRDPKLDQFAVDAVRTPERIGDTHLADQITDFPAHPGPSKVA
jgi:hypothetical protein